jgi:hypothetical protein
MIAKTLWKSQAMDGRGDLKDCRMPPRITQFSEAAIRDDRKNDVETSDHGRPFWCSSSGNDHVAYRFSEAPRVDDPESAPRVAWLPVRAGCALIGIKRMTGSACCVATCACVLQCL